VRRTPLLLFALILIGALLLYFSHVVARRPPSFLSFSQHRSEDYYSKFASACDALLKIMQPGPKELRLLGNDSRLPQVLAAMEPTFVEISTNRVLLVMEARGYGVAWEQDDQTPGNWRLAAFAGSGPIPLFTESRTNR
jgi:hypothetical protein